MRFAASTFIWASPFGDAHLDLCAHVAKLGFDVIEVCVERPDELSAEALKAAADAAGVGVSVCGAFGPDRDISHEDPSVRAAALAYLEQCIDVAAATGSTDVIGPMYSATGKTRLLPEADRERQRAWAVEGLRAAADYAAEQGVGLAIEPLNRFETDLVNTVEQGVALCERIDRRNIGLLLDTFHMNIEERDIAEAIRSAGRFLRHFHACENDRGTPGAGHVEWDDIAAALRDVGFDGVVAIESFTPEIEEIARAVSIWRPVAENGDALAADGLRFLRDTLAAPAAGTGSA